MTSHLQMSTQSGNGRHHHLQWRAMKALQAIASMQAQKVRKWWTSTCKWAWTAGTSRKNWSPAGQTDATASIIHSCHSIMGQALSSVPQHVNLPQHDGMPTRQHVSLPEHVNLPEDVAMSTQQHVSFPQHAHQLVPKHATQLAKTTVPVVGRFRAGLTLNRLS